MIKVAKAILSKYSHSSVERLRQSDLALLNWLISPKKQKNLCLLRRVNSGFIYSASAYLDGRW